MDRCGLLKLWIRLVKKSDFVRKIAHFLVWTMGEQEGEKERVQDFFLRSSEFHWSEFIRLRTKVHRLGEGYACVPKRRISLKIQMRIFGEIKVFKLRRCS